MVSLSMLSHNPTALGMPEAVPTHQIKRRRPRLKGSDIATAPSSLRYHTIVVGWLIVLIVIVIYPYVTICSLHQSLLALHEALFEFHGHTLVASQKRIVKKELSSRNKPYRLAISG
jgi:hypothetical protein